MPGVDLVNRDVLQIAAIEKGAQMRSLIALLAGRCGQVVSATNLANDLGVSKPTIERYLGVLREVFLIKQIPAFSRGSTRAPLVNPS